MANTYTYQPMKAYINGPQKTIETLESSSTGTIAQGDILFLASGVLTKSASNRNTALAGIASHAAAGGVAGYVSASPGTTTLFGKNTINTALTPASPQNLKYYPFHNGNLIEASLVQAWNINLVGTTFGILLDSGTGAFVLDNTQANNTVFTLVELLNKPDVTVAGANAYATGDVGVRVLAWVSLASALAV